MPKVPNSFDVSLSVDWFKNTDSIKCLLEYFEEQGLRNSDQVNLKFQVVPPPPSPAPPKHTPGAYEPEPAESTEKQKAQWVQNKLPFDLDKTPAWFTRALKSILKDNKMARIVRKRKDGYLDHKTLYKAVVDGRCFYKPKDRGDKEYSLVLLCDVSGSMSSSRINHAAEAALRLHKDFSDIMDTSIMSFNAKITKHTDFGEAINKEKAAIIYNELINMAMNRYHYGNHDGYAVACARHALLKRKGNKMLMVLSDGQPACNGGCGQPGCYENDELLKQNLRDEIKITEKNGIHLYSVGIQTNCTQKYYKHNQTITQMDELYPSIIKLLKATVKRI